MSAVKYAILIMIFLTISLATGQVGPKLTESVGRAEHFLVQDKIYKTVTQKLPKQHTHHALAVTNTIMEQARKYKIDPLMITAVIAGESSFNPNAVGPVGEIGLMQIRPATGEWIAKKMGLEWKGKQSLRNPMYNIKIGVAYLSHLKKRFSPQGGLLYLAAYNMGGRSLLRILSKNIQPNIYSLHIMKNYLVINE